MASARTVLLVNVDIYCIEEGSGPPLLVHHGGPGLDHTVIAPHLGPLGEGVHVVCFDHRGTGRSAVPQGPDPYHIDRFVADIAALADGLSLGPFALLGHSFGGVVALHFALAHPGLLTQLVLVSTPASHHYIEDVESALPDLLEPAALAELASLQNGEPSAQVMRRSLELLAPIYFADPARVSQLGLDSVRFGPETQAVWESLEGFDLRPRLGEIRVPALVVAGAQDRAVTVSRAKELANGLREGKLRVIEKSGHYPFIEAPDQFLAGVREFLGIKTKKKGLFGRRPA